MSCIGGVGSSTSTATQQIQASANKQTPKAATPASSQAAQSSGNDPDHDGDTHGGGINVTA